LGEKQEHVFFPYEIFCVYEYFTTRVEAAYGQINLKVDLAREIGGF